MLVAQGVQGTSALIRIEDAPPESRLEYLRYVVADTIVPFGVWTDTDRDLRAQIHSGRVGTVDVTKVSGPPIRASRARKLIRASDPELFKIDVLVRGDTVFEQDDREAVLTPGDFTLVDLSRPCSLADRGDAHEIVAVKFSRTALPLRDDELRHLTAVAISGREGLGTPVSSLARYLVEHLDGGDSTAGARLATALMDLLIVTLAERLDRARTLEPATRRRALLARVQNFIDEQLANYDLSPTAIAAAHNISLRQLHKLFERQPTGVAGWIRQRRLERCRSDLLDPALAHYPVSAIARRWGLADPAHFSRTFRAAYGISPTQYRRTPTTAPSS